MEAIGQWVFDIFGVHIRQPYTVRCDLNSLCTVNFGLSIPSSAFGPSSTYTGQFSGGGNLTGLTFPAGNPYFSAQIAVDGTANFGGYVATDGRCGSAAPCFYVNSFTGQFSGAADVRGLPETAAPIPEPASILLVSGGLAALLWRRR